MKNVLSLTYKLIRKKIYNRLIYSKQFWVKNGDKNMLTDNNFGWWQKNLLYSLPNLIVLGEQKNKILLYMYSLLLM